jgi:PAS domain S-box-containing protein
MSLLDPPAHARDGAADAVFAGPGEMRARCRSFDWATTPLGPVANWPQSLRTTADLCLGSATPSFVWWGPELVQLYNDAALATVRGRPPAMLGVPARVAWADVWPAVGALIDELLATGQAVRGDEVPLGLEHGAPVETARLTFSPARDERGVVAGVFCTVLETTDHLRAEAALRASEAKYRSLFEASEARLQRMMNVQGVGVLTFDAKSGTLVDTNDAFLELTGYTRDQVEKRELTWRTLTPKKYVPESELQIASLGLTGRLGPYEKEYFKADGSRSWMLFAGSALGDGLVVEYCIDVSERKHAEAALAATEARFRTLAELAPVLLWEMDPTGNEVSLTTAQWGEYTGGTLAEAQRGGWFETVHPDDRERTTQVFAEAFATEQPLENEQRIRRHDGVYHWFLVRQLPIRDADGRVIRWIGSAADIHAQRMAFEEVERRVAERTGERDVLRRQLLEAEEAERRRLARELHDQLGQELTAFRLGLDDALRLVGPIERAGDGHERLRARLAALHALADRMTVGTRSIALALRPPELDDAGLEDALATYVNEWAERYGVSAETVATGFDDDRGVPADIASALYRIAQEALNNVAKHARATQVSVIVDRSDDAVRLIVEDDGTGFDVEAVRDPARRERRLGLAGMQERASLGGGSLVIESSPGAGTTLYVVFPTAG